MGTLDPDAEGVLPICIGRATKLADYAGDTKRYRAVLRLGMESDTLDDTGRIINQSPVMCSRDEISAAVLSFIGNIEQLPPMYSAVKVGGRKLYELAREGKTVERKQRQATIHNISILEFLDDTSLVLDIKCSKGTYIRTLCADIGSTLGCGGVMGKLVRTASGNFCIDGAVKLTDLPSPPDLPIIPANMAIPHPELTLRVEDTDALYNGRRIPCPITMDEYLPGSLFWIMDYIGNLASLHELDNLGTLKPVVMIGEKPL